MRQIIIIVIKFIAVSCKAGIQSKENSDSILQKLSVLFVRANRSNLPSISGTAVEGVVKKANVTVNPVTKEGTCDT